MEKPLLYLASKSSARQKLLASSDIPYRLVSHASEECVVVQGGSYQDHVIAIARDKMKHVDLESIPGDTVYLLTADTLAYVKDCTRRY